MNGYSYELSLARYSSLHYDSVLSDDVEETPDAEKLSSDTLSSCTINGRLDIHNLMAEQLLNIILINPGHYIQATHMKGVRRDCLYAIKNESINNFNCDDNGSYRNNGSNKKTYYVIRTENKIERARRVHNDSNNRFYYKERKGRQYYNEYVPSSKCIPWNVFSDATKVFLV